MKKTTSSQRSHLAKLGRPSAATNRRPRGRKPLLELLEPRLVLSTTWIGEGPAPINDPGPTADAIILSPNNPTSGAVTGVAASPTDPNLLYVATSNGGVWKTTNATAAIPTFTPLTDNLPSLSLGSLVMQPGNQNVLYAGTADLSAYSHEGGTDVGIYKTTNAGATWTILGTKTLGGQDVLAIAPSTALGGNLVLASTSPTSSAGTTGPATGVYRSTDGGTTWTRRSSLGGLPDAPSSQVINDPADATGLRFYAAVPGSGVYLSGDGGLNWSAVNTGLINVQGSVRIQLAIHNDPTNNDIYADVYNGTSPTKITGIFRSANKGGQWTAIGTTPFSNSVEIPHGGLVADPVSPSVVYVSGDTYPGDGLLAPVFEGDSSTGTWTLLTGDNANGTNPHDDTRNLNFDANGNLILGSDGGLARLTNANTAAAAWVSVNGNLATNEFHSVGYDSVNHEIIGGAQDDGTSAQTTKGGTTWTLVGGGDGGNVVVDNDQVAHPGTSIRYTASQKLGGFSRTTYKSDGTVASSTSIALKITNGPYAGKTVFTSGTVDFNEQYAVDAVKSTRLLTASTNRLYESFNQGDTLTDLGIQFTSTPYSLVYGGKSGGVSNPDVLYYANGYDIWFRDKAGQAPVNRTNYPGQQTYAVAVDTNNYKNVFALDNSGDVYGSIDAGVTWTKLTGNLGTLGNTLKTLTVYSSPDDTKIVVLVGGLSNTGAQGGIFALNAPNSGGTTWTNLGTGLPNAIVESLVYNATDDILVAGTLGRGAFEVAGFAGGLSIQGGLGASSAPSGGASSSPPPPGGSPVSAFGGPQVASTPATGTPTRLKDINTTGSIEPVKYLTNVNGTVYFTQTDGTHGRELFKSDGTAAGTVLVKDINPGSNGSYPTPLGVVGGTLYFSADDGSHGYELWKTDGTTSGTLLVKDINAGSTGSYPAQGVVVGGTLYFEANDGTHGYELWKSDGTAAGTALVRDINPGTGDSYLGSLTAVAGTLFFSADDGSHGNELWKSDGTAAGTLLVKDINPGANGSYPHDLTAIGSTLYFAASDAAHGDELWKSDGTAAGTVLVKDINPGASGSDLASFTVIGSTIYFSADDGSHGDELWKTDGTSAGTTLVADIDPGSAGSYPTDLTNFNGTLYFSADDGTHGYELWKTDGSSAGTTAVGAINPSYLTAVGGTLYFSADDGTHGYELWKTDGSTAGTVLAADINPGAASSDPAELLNVNGTLFFQADNGLNGPELWKANASGIGLVADISPGTADSITLTGPGSSAGLGKYLFFPATDGTGGAQLWKTDGTPQGTQLVLDIDPGNTQFQITDLTTAGGLLYFVAKDGAHGVEIWKSDGTTAGTAILDDINPGSVSSDPSHLTPVGNLLYFDANDGVHGNELWKTDGTAGGTVLVSDINPGSDGSSPNYLTVVGGSLFFQADNGTSGQELWKTDGNPGGTVLVKDINPGAGGSAPANLTAVGGTLFFSANDGTHGYELFKSDGTAAGTVLVKDINPGANGSYLRNLVAVGSTLYFAASDGTNGQELWKTDGTAAGTALVKDINPGAADSNPSYLTAVGGTLFFSANDNTHGYELWKTDGTTAGTVLVKDINPTDDSNPKQLTNYNGTLYFTANDGVHGNELWKSDGTNAGTQLVADINPAGSGTADSEQGATLPPGPVNLTVFNGLLFFADDDGSAGNEPYVLDVPADVTSQTSATSSGLTYNRAQKEYFGTLTVANTSPTPIKGGFRVVLHGVPAGVTLDGATILVNGTLVALTIQVDANGDIEILIPQADQAGLAAGASFKLNLKWHNPANAFINYSTRLLSDPLL